MLAKLEDKIKALEVEMLGCRLSIKKIKKSAARKLRLRKENRAALEIIPFDMVDVKNGNFEYPPNAILIYGRRRIYPYEFLSKTSLVSSLIDTDLVVKYCKLRVLSLRSGKDSFVFRELKRRLKLRLGHEFYYFERLTVSSLAPLGGKYLFSLGSKFGKDCDLIKAKNNILASYSLDIPIRYRYYYTDRDVRKDIPIEDISLSILPSRGLSS